jgi:hypothetical protein
MSDSARGAESDILGRVSSPTRDALGTIARFPARPAGGGLSQWLRQAGVDE